MESNFIIYLAVMFCITYIIRIVPLLLFRKEIKNTFVRSFLSYIPYAVLASMTFPAIFHAVNNPIAGIGAAVVGIILALLKCGLCTVAAGTAAAAYILMLIF